MSSLIEMHQKSEQLANYQRKPSLRPVNKKIICPFSSFGLFPYSSVLFLCKRLVSMCRYHGLSPQDSIQAPHLPIPQRSQRGKQSHLFLESQLSIIIHSSPRHLHLCFHLIRFGFKLFTHLKLLISQKEDPPEDVFQKLNPLQILTWEKAFCWLV